MNAIVGNKEGSDGKDTDETHVNTSTPEETEDSR
jgi:hypothetical protein